MPEGPLLERDLIDSLFPADLPEPAHWETRYPPRTLPDGAQVTRFGPSPTGFVHIGGVYVAMIDRDLAGHSGGAYIVRVEDTDQAREVAGAWSSSTVPSTTSTCVPTSTAPGRARWANTVPTTSPRARRST